MDKRDPTLPRYTAELLPSNSPLHGAVARERNRSGGGSVLGESGEDVYEIIDRDHRNPRHPVAWCRAADAPTVLAALNEAALQRTE